MTQTAGTVIAPELKATALPGPRPQLKVLGIIALLIAVCLITVVANPRFALESNLTNVLRRTSLFGIIAIGVAFVIITSGIDLSIGSVIALVGTMLPWLIVDHRWPIAAAIPTVMLIALVIGLFHGVYVTKLKIQPFVVTLCGMLMYRGITRGILHDQTKGFGTDPAFDGLRSIATGTFVSIPVPFLQWIGEGNWSSYTVHRFTGARTELPMVNWLPIPTPFLILVGLAIVAAIFLNRTIYGRYLLALGRNEQAARYSGINTDRMTILAYVICSLLGGLGGILFMLEVNSGQPSDFGNFYELYAIAAAVLGGCSLRGGEGAILGVVIGAAVMQVLRNSINLLGIGTQWEFAIIGAVLLAGVTVDELVKRYAARRRAARQAL